MESSQVDFWKKCSSCKKHLGFDQPHYVCSVSTCNGQRTGYVFCSIACFEVHLPGARHKDAAAIEARSPKKITNATEATHRPPEKRRIIAGSPSSVAERMGSTDSVSKSQSHGQTSSMESQEVLVIASRLKDFIQKKAEMNTSADVMQVLSQHLRVICERAIDQAKASGRKTVMGRDFDFLKRS